MSSPTGSSQWFANPGGDFYNGVATQSLKFAYTSAETWLAITPDAGNRKTHTLSVWVKRSGLGASQNILEATGSGDAGNTDIWFDANDLLEVSGANTYFRVTTQRFRDTSAWYHLVFRFDTTQGTANNRLLIYVNGSVITDFATNNNYSQNTDYGIGGNVEHRIGDGYGHFDGYMARYEFIDGLSLGPENFGETKNGVWIAKAYGGSYGTNGHKLEFKEIGTSANSSGLGADTSGNGNHYTPTAIVASDSAMPDSPENNFCTLNPLANINSGSNHASVHSDGNLHAINNGSNISHLYGTFRINDFLTNGCYFEARIISIDTSRFYFGIIDPLSYTGVAVASYENTQKAVMNHLNRIFSNLVADGNSTFNPNSMAGGEAIKANDIVGVAIKGDNVWFHVNGVYTKDASNTVGNPSSGANPSIPAITAIATTDYFPYFGYASAYHVNFGQNPSFAGYLTGDNIGTETADEGAGVFKYAVPTGFQAICSANMPDPTIGPNSSTNSTDNFNAVLWTGNGGDDRSIGGVGFKPDFVWLKQRNGTNYHTIFDSTRGATKAVYPNDPEAEATNADTLQAFESDGFELGTSGGVNGNNNTFVAWNWKANGGTTSTLTGGTIDSVVQANTDAGFSIVTYTGDDQARATVAHGLSKAPEMIIVKNRGEAISNPAWPVYHASNTSAPATDYLDLSDDGGTDDAETLWSDEVPTDTLVILGTADSVNSGSAHVMYCFHSVEGYSKLGSYVTNAGNSGPFVHTGFRPAFVMVKVTGGGSNASYWSWTIYDNKRVPFNRNHSPLFANHNVIENFRGDGSTNSGGNTLYFDFLSNGFRVMNGGTEANGTAGSPVVYMAFAEMPFKYTNAK